MPIDKYWADARELVDRLDWDSQIIMATVVRYALAAPYESAILLEESEARRLEEHSAREVLRERLEADPELEFAVRTVLGAEWPRIDEKCREITKR